MKAYVIQKKRRKKSARGTKGGFSLVESLVAITILLVAIIVPMTIASQGLQASFFAYEQTTAVYLAQEGVEMIQLLRDENALENVYSESPAAWVLCQNNVLPDSLHPEFGHVTCEYDSWEWYDDLPAACTDEAGCDINPVRGSDGDDGFEFIACTTENDCRLRYGDIEDGKYYEHEAGDYSPFRRVITVEEVLPEQEVEVTVEVSWRANLFGQIATTSIQTRITNQYNVSEFSDPVTGS